MHESEKSPQHKKGKEKWSEEGDERHKLPLLLIAVAAAGSMRPLLPRPAMGQYGALCFAPRLGDAF